jgi:hypothetical protein
MLRNAMSESKFASGACHKSMWRKSAFHSASMSAVKTREARVASNAAAHAGAPRFHEHTEQHEDREEAGNHYRL